MKSGVIRAENVNIVAADVVTPNGGAASAAAILSDAADQLLKA